MKHGGAGYAYEQGCRCEVCVEAWNARHRELRAARSAREVPDSVPHGVRSTYVNYGCRCAACYQAQAEANRNRPSRAKARP